MFVKVIFHEIQKLRKRLMISLSGKKLFFYLFFSSLLFFITSCEQKITREQFLQNSSEVGIGVAYCAEIDSQVKYWKGFELAAELINKSGGILGKSVRLIKADDKGEVTQGLKVAREFVNDLSIAAVLGHVNSSVTESAANLYNSSGLIMLTPASTSPNLIKKEYKYIFRTIPTDRRVIEEMMIFLKKAGFDKVAVYYADDHYGRGVADAFEDVCINYGIEAVDRVNDINERNFREIIRRWMAFECNAVLIGEAFEDSLELINLIKGDGEDTSHLDD